MKLKLNLVGVDAVQKILKTLPQDMRDNILYDINRAGAKIVQKEIIALAPDDPEETDPTNKIENNIVVVKGKGSRTLAQTGIRKRSFHSRFVEFGTRVRKTRKKVNRGKMPARPFIRRAHEQSVPKALKYVSSNYLRIIYRSLKKYAKRYR